MAYAAVASLSQTIDLVLVYHQGSISPHFRNQIISLHQHIMFFQSFLEDGTVRTNNWEETIREVTDRAEVIVELILSDFLLKPSAGSSESKFEKGDYDGSDDLQSVTEEIESIANRVKRKHVGAASGSDDGVMKIISQLRGLIFRGL